MVHAPALQDLRSPRRLSEEPRRAGGASGNGDVSAKALPMRESWRASGASTGWGTVWIECEEGHAIEGAPA